jgi:hypothetical protein
LSFYFNKSDANNFTTPKQCIQHIATDSLGIPISSHQFDSLVQALLIRFQSDTSVAKIEDDLLFVKASNTIAFCWLEDKKEIYHELFYLFGTKYVNKIVKVLDAQMSKGLSYYSRQYDLQIGGWKTRNNFCKLPLKLGHERLEFFKYFIH